MANIINKVSQFAGAGNTGAPLTVIEEGIPTGVIVVPSNWNLSDAELQSAATAIAALQADTYAARAARIFPIGPFANIEAQDTDRTTEESALGFRRTIRRGKIGWRFEIWAGGSNYHQSVFSFDGTDNKMVIIDDKNNIIGTWVKDSGGVKEFYGCTISDFSVSNYMMPNGTVGAKFTIDVQMANDAELNSAKAIVNLGVPVLTNVTGLRNVELADAVSATPDVVHVEATTDTGSTNVYDFYSAELNQAGAWKVLDAADGTTTVTVASVALVPAKKAWALTLTSPPTAVLVDLKDTVTLHGLVTPVDGIESTGSIQITVP